MNLNLNTNLLTPQMMSQPVDIPPAPKPTVPWWGMLALGTAGGVLLGMLVAKKKRK